MGDHDAQCVFCDIAAGKAPAYRILEDDLSFAILDINPFAKGHCLVISKRHIPWWHEMTEAETASLFNLARVVANRMHKVFKPDMVLTYARGRRIPHTHIFLVPTYNGDLLDRFFNALEKFQESPPDLTLLRDKSAMEETARILRESE
ncbi:ATP adenylyltransferase [Anaerolineae bacterium]|nr:ATP adenylyltransferase [Anaerolineae bacterium]